MLEGAKTATAPWPQGERKATRSLQCNATGPEHRNGSMCKVLWDYRKGRDLLWWANRGKLHRRGNDEGSVEAFSAKGVKENSVEGEETECGVAQVTASGEARWVEESQWRWAPSVHRGQTVRVSCVIFIWYLVLILLTAWSLCRLLSRGMSISVFYYDNFGIIWQMDGVPSYRIADNKDLN